MESTDFEDGSLRNPLAGFFSPETIEEALEFLRLLPEMAHIKQTVTIAKAQAARLAAAYPKLRIDQRACIVIYTMEAFPREVSVRSWWLSAL